MSGDRDSGGRDAAQTLADADLTLYGEELTPGAAVGEYVIQRTIASGGCGVVYEAEHRLLKRKSAVKVLRHEMASNPRMLRRFLREAQSVNVIKHPNIVDVFDFGTLKDGRPYFVMEYLEGEDLSERLARAGPMTAGEVLQCLEPICAALGAAHELGIVHRDLKGSNIFVERATGDVKLLDFGIAKLLHPVPGESDISALDTTLGTPHTMAPEQVSGADIDGRTDVYALGVVLFELLTGRYPFEGKDPYTTQVAHLSIPAPRPSKYAAVSREVDAVVLRCMQKQPDDRYATVSDFIEALRCAVSSSGSESIRGKQHALALAICVSAPTGTDPEEPSDEVLDALESMEEALMGAGFSIVASTADTLVGAIELPATADIAPLMESIAAESNAIAELCVGVHVADAERDAAGAFVGGPLLDLGTWTGRRANSGIWCTREAASAIPELKQRAVDIA